MFSFDENTCLACWVQCDRSRFCCALAKNVPPARFLNARLRAPIRFAKNKRHPVGVFVFGADDGSGFLRKRLPRLLGPV